MEFFEWGLDECQWGAYIVCRVDEEVNLVIRYVHGIGRLEVFACQDEYDEDNEKLH